MTLVLTWTRPSAALQLDWRGPQGGSSALASAVISGTASAVVVGPPGPQGPAGPQGAGSGTMFTVSAASSSWIIAHGLGRRPNVTVYLSTGEQVLTDCNATVSSVNVVFPSPQTGYVVVT